MRATIGKLFVAENKYTYYVTYICRILANTGHKTSAYIDQLTEAQISILKTCMQESAHTHIHTHLECVTK